MVYYKVLNERDESMHGGSGAWVKGRRRVARGPIVACENGIHLCRREDLVLWLGPRIWVAEPYGAVVDAGDKVVCRGATLVRRLTRWNERTARLFAADVAEAALRALSWTPNTHPVFFTAVDAARQFARGEIDDAAREAAAESAAEAARPAAGAAWSAAARSAAWSAQTEILFDYLEGRRS